MQVIKSFSIKFVVFCSILCFFNLCHAGWLPVFQSTAFDLKSIHFPVDAQTGYAVGYGYNEAYVFKTTNGGWTWNPQTTGLSGGLKAVYFPMDTETGYAVGDHGLVIKTTNGGGDWAAQYSGVTSTLCAVQFPLDCDTGFAAGYDGVIIKTIDGGGSFVAEQAGKKFIGTQFCIQPNPFISTARVPGYENRLFNIYDVAGSLVATCRGMALGKI